MLAWRRYAPDWTPSGGYFRANWLEFLEFFSSILHRFTARCVGLRIAVDPGSAEKPSIDLKTFRSCAWRCISRIQGFWLLQGQQTCELGAACCSVLQRAAVLRPRPCSTVHTRFATRSFRTPVRWRWDAHGDARRVSTTLRFGNESRRRRPSWLWRSVV